MKAYVSFFVMVASALVPTSDGFFSQKVMMMNPCWAKTEQQNTPPSPLLVTDDNAQKRSPTSSTSATTALLVSRAIDSPLLVTDDARRSPRSTSARALYVTTTIEDLSTSTADDDNEDSSEELNHPQQQMDKGIYHFNKFVVDSVYHLICHLYPVCGTERDFARFFVLETVARVPYFAYLSVLHLRETFGEREDPEELSDRMVTHYAEADNELHHLLIMESLGGNSTAIDRHLAHVTSVAYFWYVAAVYLVNPQAAYHLSELIEDHAYNTYDEYLKQFQDQLKTLPVPDIARKYYIEDNHFLFDKFCTVKSRNSGGPERRPTLNSLYDVFVNIRDDEKEHWKTLCNLVQYDSLHAADAEDVHSTRITTY